MKRSWFNPKPHHKQLKRKKGLSASRKARRDQGQRRVPPTDRVTELFRNEFKAMVPAVCVRCGDGRREDDPLEVSHYFNVRKSGTRFWFDNVDLLHRSCHTGPNGWEYRKKEEYREHMVAKLGEEGLQELSRRAHQPCSLEQAKADFMEWMGRRHR